MMRAGDTVRPKDGRSMEYMLACDERDGYAAVCGWPDGDIRCCDWTVTKAASDTERLGTLRLAARSRDDHGGRSRRALIALEQLGELEDKCG